MSGNKKKILYIITKSVWGGAQKYVYDLATNLPKNNFEVFVAGGPKIFSSNKESVNLISKLKDKDISYLEIKSFQRDINIFKEFIASFEILKILFKTKPEIVHVSSSKAGGIAGVTILLYKIITFKKIKTIFTIHGWAFLELRPEWQIALIKFFSWITCLFYNQIITVSEYGRQIGIKNKIISDQKSTTIHNSINEKDYNFLSKESARKDLLPDLGARPLSDIWVGTIGEYTKNKGQKYLIEAIKLLITRYPLTVTLIGWGEEKENLKKQIKELELEDSVFLIDSMGNDSQYLKAFDIFILPSVKEGLPYTLLEAGLAERPIVSTKTGGIPEIIEHLKTGLLVDPTDSEKLSIDIREIIENREAGEIFAKNIKQKITDQFSFEKMIHKTIEVYS